MNYEIIADPHLPKGKVCHIACGILPLTMRENLQQHVEEIITLEPVKTIESSLSSHADLALCPLPDKKIIISDSQRSIKEKLISLGFCVIIEGAIRSPYPNDCKLNFLNTNYYTIINNNIHNVKFFNNCQNLTINVKQGYVKCSVVPVSKNAIITDDPSVAKMAEKYGLDVCYVGKGDIRLDGYPYGFIGGCCGMLSKHAMAFCGHIESHRDHRKIREFLLRYNIEVICLSDDQLTDVGSLIPLTQRKAEEL